MKSQGFTVEGLPICGGFLGMSECSRYLLLIADVHMPQMNGIELHRRLVGSGYAIPTILITAYPDDSVRARAWLMASFAT
jgi:FixJ family two-component response regulator